MAVLPWKGSAGGPWNGETRTNGQIKGGDEDHREHGMYPIRYAVGAATKSYCNYSKNWKTDSTEGKPHKSQPSGGSGFRTQEGWEDQVAGSENMENKVIPINILFFIKIPDSDCIKNSIRSSVS